MDQTQTLSPQELLSALTDALTQLSDSEVGELFGDGRLNTLLTAIADPSKVHDYPTIADFFLAHKHRLSTMAAIRSGISRACSFQSKSKRGYASPSDIQWFDDGVMLTEGREPFGGILGVYRDGKMQYAVTARDARAGESLGKDDFHFLTHDEYQKRHGQVPVNDKTLDDPVTELEQLLNNRDPDESKYQELLDKYPWVFGLQYCRIQRHTNLDDKNIPDFTGSRNDGTGRDVFEIKPSSMRIQLANGDLSADFNQAWNQAERYLHFARTEKDYLERKGLRFENPICYLICGYELNDSCIAQIRVKERMNPALKFMTYDDLLAFMKSTVKFIREMDR